MAAPCVVDTCSIQSLIDPITRKLQLDVRLDPAGGLQCGNLTDANAGLGIKLADDCGQFLSLNAAGELLATATGGLGYEATTDFVAIPHAGTDEVDVLSFQRTNPYDCDMIGAMYGRYETRFKIEGSALPDTYRAHLLWRTLIGGSSAASAGSTAVHQHIGGRIDTGENNEVSDQWDYFVSFFRWQAGLAKTFVIDARHYDTGERINVNTESAGYGGQAYAGVAILPIKWSNLAT